MPKNFATRTGISPQIIDRLVKSNVTFKKLFEKHRDLDSRLRDMDKKVYLTPEQQTEISRLKKLKLRNKDQMEAILSQHASSRTIGSES